MPLGSVAGVPGRALALTSHQTGSGVRRDALVPHHPGEVLPSLPQRGFVDVKSATLFALGSCGADCRTDTEGSE